MKSLKVNDEVHKELKIFAAQASAKTITEHSETAIMEYLKSRQHKFSKKQSNKKP